MGNKTTRPNRPRNGFVTPVKAVILGSGKSIFLNKLNVPRESTSEYHPMIEDSFRYHYDNQGNPFLIEFLEPSGDSQFTAMRDLYYSNAEVFVICFSCISSSTFVDLTDIIDGIMRVRQGSSLKGVLVSVHCDRGDERVVSQQEGRDLAKRSGLSYCEITQDGEGYDEVLSNLVNSVSVSSCKK
eukprot:TRINITY_DN7927_c0_g1_i1.p1 TRINITY_DN7927_c0_g1~~TRINITY_DN7927_c0_g1_i1.p1  ORF type:complete len:184 (+),score=28.35 TRINITY_DN7927_c0_g1_i1:232-783(+)